MKFLLPVLINLFVSSVKPCQLNSVMSKQSLYVIAGVILRSSGHPSHYEYEEDLLDDSIEVTRTTLKNLMIRSTTTTEESGQIHNEWRLRGEYRIACVHEVGIVPTKVVNLMNARNWSVKDVDLQKWALCVLNKMNLMSKEGVFKMDVAMSKLADKDKPDAESLIDYCLPKNPMEPHEIAWTYVQCQIKNADQNIYSAINVF